MVDTRRLEQLLQQKGQPSARSGSGSLPALVPSGGRRLALSGGPSLRSGSASRAVARRNDPAIDAAWANLDPISADPAPWARQRDFNALGRAPDLAKRFDVLRAQLEATFQKRNLRSLGITAPARGAGASFSSAGLLASFGRRQELRVVGLDMHLAAPALHGFFEAAPAGPIMPMIEGDMPVESHLQLAGPNLALGLNAQADDNSVSAAVFEEMIADITDFLAPDIVICDMPPLLDAGDAALNLLPALDAVLLVVDARKTRAEDIAACERNLADQTEFLGVVMNHSSSATGGR
ncbi:MAG: hypothetical protein JJT99_08625 [Rhodobacteraceae bacterium]|nr:hypothetical protein [Paracoccaceae bacterium]